MKILLRKGYSGKRFTLSRARLAEIPELIYLLSPRELMPHSLYRAFKAIREKLGKDLTELIIVNYCEQAAKPREQSVFEPRARQVKYESPHFKLEGRGGRDSDPRAPPGAAGSLSKKKSHRIFGC